jgi:signal transduction histidine kinase
MDARDRQHRYNGDMRRLWAWIWAANPYVVDGLIAAFIAITTTGAMFHADAPRRAFADGDWIGFVLILVTAVPLAWRRATPTRILPFVAAGFSIYFLRGYADGTLGMAVAIAVWTVVTRDPLPRIGGIAAIGVPLIPLSAVVGPEPSLVGNAISNALFFAGAAITGHNVRLRREKRAGEERTVEALADRAVSEERLRIARELHDVVAHAMSVVTVQSGVAAHVIDTQPDEAKRMLENIRVTSHEALDEMRRLLGVLRGTADLAPAPSLRDVEELAASLRASGVPVSVLITGDRLDVPGGVDLTAYRIVQEALTNVLKHAGPSSATVSVEYGPGVVVVEITDDGRGAAAIPTGESGHGLLGMRERVAVFGGDLVAGPRPGGGFGVRATLPYAAATA